MKNILIIIGPSGSGKNTLGNFLKELGWVEFVSHTTRNIRQGETNGIDYHFVSVEEFMNTDKIEYAEYAGNYYGLSVKEVNEKTEKYDNCYCIVEKNGALNLKKIYPDAKILFVYNTPKTLEKRMKERGNDEETINKRINNIFETKELENYKLADIIIRNDSWDKAKEQLQLLIKNNLKINYLNNLKHKIVLFFINKIYKNKITGCKN